MRLPAWIPQVRKPWNPAYHGTWEAMTPNERRWSTVIDLGVLIIAGLVWLVFELV